MVTLFSGLPRSGKSYKMTAEAWKLKDKYFIVHNIIGFKNEVLDGFGFDWVEYIDREKIEVDVFFSKDYQQELSKKVKEKYDRPMLVIIDEAHEWFDVHKKVIKMWLSYHGHLNQQIYLCAHASTNIPKVYRSFVAVEYRAKSSIFLFLPNYFFYNRILGGVSSGYIFEKKDQKIFDLYKSSDVEETKKKKSFYIPMLVLFVVVGFILFILSPSFIFKKPKQDKKIDDVKVNQNIKGGYGQMSSSMKGGQNSGSGQPVVIEESFDKVYAYVGNINNEPILEDRKTGNQYPLSRIAGEYKFVKGDRANNCVLFGKDMKLYTIYNYDRFIQKEAPTGAPQNPINMLNTPPDARLMSVNGGV